MNKESWLQDSNIAFGESVYFHPVSGIIDLIIFHRLLRLIPMSYKRLKENTKLEYKKMAEEKIPPAIHILSSDLSIQFPIK